MMISTGGRHVKLLQGRVVVSTEIRSHLSHFYSCGTNNYNTIGKENARSDKFGVPLWKIAVKYGIGDAASAILRFGKTNDKNYADMTDENGDTTEEFYVALFVYPRSLNPLLLKGGIPSLDT